MTELKDALTFTVADIAEALEISEDKVRRLMHGGWIHWYYIGREMRVNRKEMERILEEGTKATTIQHQISNAS